MDSNPRSRRPQESPAARAEALLGKALAEGAWQAGDRLPPLRDLAKQAGTSASAMAAALRRLASRGRVTILRRGIYAGVPPEPARPFPWPADHPSPREPRVLKWESVRRDLERDILEGRLPPEAGLLRFPELCERYGACRPTLKKALEDLRVRRILTLGKGGYRLPGANRSGRSAVLFVYVRAPEAEPTFFQDEFARDFIPGLRKACQAAELPLLMAAFHPAQGRLEFLGDSRRQARGALLLGYAVWSSFLDPAGFRRLIRELARLEPPQGRKQPGTLARPMAILDGRGGNIALPAGRAGETGEVADLPGVRTFIVAQALAGREAARHLLRLGHQRAAFLSGCHREPWSQRRLEGLRAAFRDAGRDGAVSDFVADLRDDVRAFPPLPAAVGRRARRLEAVLADMAVRGTPEFHPSLLDPLRKAHLDFVHHARLSRTLDPLLERLVKAFPPAGGLALVAANDPMALYARQWLARRGWKSPGPLAILGFDDSLSAADYGLTSFNFNFHGVAQKMVGFILAPQRMLALEPGGLIECEGRLEPRESTGSRA